MENKIFKILGDFKLKRITIDEATDKLLLLHNVIEQSEQLICDECNGEGGFQMSEDPDDCEICYTCKGKGIK